MKFRLLVVLFLLGAFSACSSPTPIKSAKVTRSNLEATVTSVNAGIVRSERIAELAFGAVGRVKMLNVKLGDIVEKGQIIAEIENENMRSSLSTATRELERQRVLVTKGISSQTLLDQAQTAMEMSSIAFDQTQIRAPFRGLIAELNLEVGQLSQITAEFRQALVRLIDLEPRYVRAEIDEVDMPRVQIGQDARIKILAVRKEPFNAKVRKLVPFVSSVREQDRTSEIELNLEADALLPVGASGDVEIVVERKSNVLTAPLRSILSRSNKKFVFVYDDGMAKSKEIELGVSSYDFAEIRLGLSEGDIVLIPSDMVELSDGMTVSLEK